MGKKVVLVTNAHYKSLTLKLKHTQLGPYFNEVITAFDIGLSKEDKKFWRKLKEKLRFDPLRTLFIDDSEAPLLAAKQIGIKYLFFKSRASSKFSPKSPLNNFSKIEYFKELIERIEK
jgi:putative hydrolase of the HAD superfamily